jgi:hypothetical protein
MDFRFGGKGEHKTVCKVSGYILHEKPLGGSPTPTGMPSGKPDYDLFS